MAPFKSNISSFWKNKSGNPKSVYVRVFVLRLNSSHRLQERTELRVIWTKKELEQGKESWKFFLSPEVWVWVRWSLAIDNQMNTVHLN